MLKSMESGIEEVENEFKKLSMVTLQPVLSFLTFCRYQASNMSTIKWHRLDHLAIEISRTGGFGYLTVYMSEKVHKLFKESYALTTNVQILK